MAGRLLSVVFLSTTVNFSVASLSFRVTSLGFDMTVRVGGRGYFEYQQYMKKSTMGEVVIKLIAR